MHRTIRGFDGIRAMAVISVVLTHLGLFQALEESASFNSLIPMVHGGTGVQAFFVLSGFLITTLLINEFNSTGDISVKHFIIRRTLRIFPLYILFLLAVTLLHLYLGNVTTWGSISYAYLYAYNFVPKDLYTPLLGHTWSLAVEEHFYLVWPTVFMLLFARHRLALIVIVLIFVASAPFVYLLLVKSGAGTKYFVERWSFIAGSSIAIGCLCAILVGSEKTARQTQRLAKHPASLIIAILLYSNSLYFSSESWFVQNVGTGYLRTTGIALGIVWIYLNQESRLATLLEFRPIKYIGLISYGIYMYQGLFLSTGPARDAGQSWPPSPAIGFALLLIAAPLSYHFFELPFLRLKGRYSAAMEKGKPQSGLTP